ncbi:MAG: hypothetical protein CMB34_02135 [Euryarchaeota archaeon]|nr:hypothetical protein [Euryarchaeota archaeon]
MKTNTEADVRSDTAIRVMAIFFAAIMFLAFTTDPIRTGTNEGDRAPPLTGMAYNGSVWTNFDINDYFDTNWTAGDLDGQWLLVDFMDTDCPFCIRSAEEVGQNADYFMKLQGDWQGPIVNFVASATELDIPGHETSRAEIEAFRDKSGEESCAGNSCATRDGSSHGFVYIDDIDQDNMKAWKVPGTPSYFLIQPDGIVAWVSSENTDEEVSDAIFRLTMGA